MGDERRAASLLSIYVLKIERNVGNLMSYSVSSAFPSPCGIEREADIKITNIATMTSCLGCNTIIDVPLKVKVADTIYTHVK